jgi:hypothetical protein
LTGRAPVREARRERERGGRTVKLFCGAVLLAGVLAVVAAAQTSIPTVAVSAGGSSITLPTSSIAAGPTRFDFTRRGRGDVDVSAILRAGVTTDQLRRTLSRNPDAALALVFIEAGASLSDATPTRSLTVELRANVTYVAVSMRGRSFGLATFTTGTPNGARAPAADATIRMVDYGFRGPSTLPRNGSIRVANRGTALHFALAFPLRPGVSDKRIGGALRDGDEKAIGRLVAGEPVTVQALISPGSTNDNNRFRFRRRGRYAFVCFFAEHNKLGMYRVFKVR